MNGDALTRLFAPDLHISSPDVIEFPRSGVCRFKTISNLQQIVDHVNMTDMLHVVGPIVFILLFTSGNVERSIWYVC